MLIKKSSAFAAAAMLVLGLTATPAAAVTGNSSWGYWDEETITFSDATGLIDATWTITEQGSWEVMASGTDGEYFVANTPVGKLFGASPKQDSTSDNTYLKVQTADDTVTESIVDITFDSEIPAKRLSLLVSDVDWDKVTVTMKNDAGDDLTANQMKGLATPNVFNFCSYSPAAVVCDNDTDKPQIVASGNSIVSTGQLASGDGASLWLNPSAAVKSIRLVILNLDTREGTYSTQRIWLAQVDADPVYPKVEKLADTGLSSNPALWFATFGLLMAGATAYRFSLKRR